MMWVVIALSALCVVLLAISVGSFLMYCRQSDDLGTWKSTCEIWRETATRRAGELTEAWKKLKEFREKAAKWDESQEEEVFHHICGRVVSGIGICNCEVCCKRRSEEGHCRYPDRSAEPLSPAMGVSGNVAESLALIPTGDSIENDHSLPADFAIDSVLASAEARSNSYG